MRAAEGSNRSRILVFSDPKKDRKTGDTNSLQDATLGGINSQFAQSLVDQPRLPYESLAANGRARFMLRMRLSLHCGCAAFATQVGSDHLFTVESPAGGGENFPISVSQNCEMESWRCYDRLRG
jgi:hypothetical protein